MRRFTLILLAVTALGVFSSLAPAQYPHNFASLPGGGPRVLVTKFMENSSTDVTTKSAWVDLMILSNTSGSAVTVRVSDKSTQCNSGVCDLVPTVSIGANTAYLVPASGGIFFKSGINWQASAANAIAVQMRYITVN